MMEFKGKINNALNDSDDELYYGKGVKNEVEDQTQQVVTEIEQEGKPNKKIYDVVAIFKLFQQKLIRELPAITLDTWIKPLVPLSVKDEKLVLKAPSSMGRDFLMQRHSTLLNNVLLRICPDLKGVVILDGLNLKEEDYLEGDETDVVPPVVLDSPLKDTQFFKPNYNFENFVVGRSNQLAFALAKAIAQNPGKEYNPLFIYGGVGLGKTHLLHAIGNQILNDFPNLKVLYCTFERFMNELISSMSGSKLAKEFRDKYRKVDVLMIDDIQFIANKERTQEEFFHTFEELYGKNKQIIISSDRPVKDINPLEERLRSRFSWDMIVDIQPPDLETRIAILQKKAQIKCVNIKPDVIEFIAQKVSSNIREMEGFFSRVVSYSRLLSRQPTVELVKDVLRDYVDKTIETVSIDNIIDAVCIYFKLTRDEITGKKKNKEIVEPRMIAIYLITEILPSIPLIKIGQVFGNRDHTTIIHARDKIAQLRHTNGRILVALEDLNEKIKYSGKLNA